MSVRRGVYAEVGVGGSVRRVETRSVGRAVQRQKTGLGEWTRRADVVKRAAFKKLSVVLLQPMHNRSDAKVIFAEISARRVSEGGGEA